MAPHPSRFAILGPLVALIVSGCTKPHIYTSPDGPIHQGDGSGELREADADPEPGQLRIASFNIKYAKEIDRAIDLIRATPELNRADLILLQEMDSTGTRRIADAVGYFWVYAPATDLPAAHHDFGDAILSRWPLSNPRKVILPHLGRFGSTQRIALRATFSLAGTPARVYSVHLATGVEVGPRGRRDQVLAVVHDAASWNGPVIIGGDLNSTQLPRVFAAEGYEWPTKGIGHTCKLWGIDHVFTRGLSPAAQITCGKINDNRGASDHRPIWITMEMPWPER